MIEQVPKGRRAGATGPSTRKPRRRRAADTSPWYVLATAHGENTGSPIDTAMRDRNRDTWNRWVSQALDERTRKLLIEEHGVEPGILAPMTAKERAAIVNLVADRLKRHRLTLPALDKAGADVRIDLSDHYFPNGFKGAGFVFPGRVSFEGSVFDDAVMLHDAVFLGDAVFTKAEIKGTAFVLDATFKKFAWFGNVVVHGTTTFSGSVFDELMTFESCTFMKEARFENVHFRSSARFSFSTFHDGAFFEGTVFAEHAQFEAVRIFGRPHFVLASFGSTTTFDDAFWDRPPDFRDAKLPFSTTWYGVSWPEVPRRLAGARDAVERYAALRHAMDTAKRHDAELDFFVRELDARRFTGIGRLHRLAIDAYLALSDGGRSLSRPALAWLLGIAASVFVHAPGDGYFALQKGAAVEMLAMILGNALVVGSAALDRRKLAFTETKIGMEVPWGLQVFDVAHTGFSALCLFLMVLAVRNWLRLK